MQGTDQRKKELRSFASSLNWNRQLGPSQTDVHPANISVCYLLECTPMWVCSMKWNPARQWWERRKTVSSTLFSVPLTTHYSVKATVRYWVTAKAVLSFQKFFAMAKKRLQNFICSAFQIRGTTLCPSTEIK